MGESRSIVSVITRIGNVDFCHDEDGFFARYGRDTVPVSAEFMKFAHSIKARCDELEKLTLQTLIDADRVMRIEK